MFLKRKHIKTGLILIEYSNDNVIYSITFNGVTVSQFENLDELLKYIKKQVFLYAYWIHVSGNILLTRIIDEGTDYKNELIIDKNEPFQFCFKKFENKLLISYWRENLTNELFSSLQLEKKHVFGISGGIIPFASKIDNESLDIDYSLTVIENQITHFERNYAFQQLNPDQIKFLYENICEYNIEEVEFNQCIEKEIVSNYLGEYFEQKKFNIIGVVSLFIILLIMISNRLYYQSITSEIYQKNQKIELEMNSTSLIFQLKEEKQRKLLLLRTSGVQSEKFLSFYADKLIGVMPSNLKLNKFEIFPINEFNKETGKVLFNNDLVTIEGTTYNSKLINEWIVKIQHFKWVLEVDILNISKVENEKFRFRINIKLKK